MDRIELMQMEFYGYHGTLPEERRLGQKFTVDVKLYFDLSAAGASDDINDTIDYAAVYETVRTVVEGEPQHLIESVAEKIANALLAGYPLEAVRIAVHKPDAPIHGKFGDVCVQIKRTQPK